MPVSFTGYSLIEGVIREPQRIGPQKPQKHEDPTNVEFVSGSFRRSLRGFKLGE